MRTHWIKRKKAVKIYAPPPPPARYPRRWNDTTVSAPRAPPAARAAEETVASGIEAVNLQLIFVVLPLRTFSNFSFHGSHR